MNKDSRFIMNILSKIGRINPDLFVYASRCINRERTYEISVSDYYFYSENVEFKKTKELFHKVSKKLGITVYFVCGFFPSAEELMGLNNSGRLFMSV